MTRLGIEVASASCRVAADIENLDEQQWCLSAAITTQGSVSPLQSTYLSMPSPIYPPSIAIALTIFPTQTGTLHTFYSDIYHSQREGGRGLYKRCSKRLSKDKNDNSNDEAEDVNGCASASTTFLLTVLNWSSCSLLLASFTIPSVTWMASLSLPSLVSALQWYSATRERSQACRWRTCRMVPSTCCR